jgi:cytochrome b involved in lipid metabolism
MTGSISIARRGITSNPWVISHIVIFLVLWLFVEGYYQRISRKETSYKDPANVITQGELVMRLEGGEQLVVLDDLVLDVSDYQWNHPGGWFVIGYNIGRDISKFFYGGYSLENSNGLKPYTHTNLARLTVNSLIVGRLQSKAQVFSCKITDAKEWMKDIYTFVLTCEGSDPGFRLPDSCDINQIGRHFLMRSFAMPSVRRHYTLATCMKREIYEEYCKVL